MPRKAKFRPRITRIKLNPEQAVLACSCYDTGGLGPARPGMVAVFVCTASKGKVKSCGRPSAAYS